MPAKKPSRRILLRERVAKTRRTRINQIKEELERKMPQRVAIEHLYALQDVIARSMRSPAYKPDWKTIDPSAQYLQQYHKQMENMTRYLIKALRSETRAGTELPRWIFQTVQDAKEAHEHITDVLQRIETLKRKGNN